MMKLSRSCLVTLVLPVAMLGCGGTGTETPTPPPMPPVNVTVTPGPGADGKAVMQGVPAKSVTPTSGINPKAQIDIVKEETSQGGEAAVGGSPFDYLWQPAKDTPAADEPLNVDVPAGLPAVAAFVPHANPLTKAKWELGRQLYFDSRISLDGTVSCATCHNPDKGWTDQSPVATGIDGQKGGRSAPTVLNTVYGRTMFWDGRAPSLEGQAQGPPQNPIEMGKQSYKQIVERLRTIPGYQEQFHKVFGTDVTLDGIAKAIATFERTVLTGNSPYDKYVGGDMKALNESQKRGMVLFGLRLSPDDDFKAEGVTLKKANCTSCHAGFNFTDEKFHNLGVGYDASKQALADLGRWAIAPIGAKDNADRGAFKTPTLRDLARTAPYMHDGSEKNLLDVIKFYDKGGNPNQALDEDMKPLKLTDQEVQDLVAFLDALNGEVRTVELPKLPPDKDGKAPDPRAALTPPAPKTAMGDLHAIFAQ